MGARGASSIPSTAPARPCRRPLHPVPSGLPAIPNGPRAPTWRPCRGWLTHT